MALNLGELSIGLELENDRFRAGLATTKRELETIPMATRREMVKVGRVMDEEGKKSGGLLSRGINSGLVRNSPLIVAGIGAALAAGAPVMMAAAGTLFAGIGAAAAAQTSEVRSAWSELGRDVRDGAISDAAVLVPVYIEMADQIGAAFQRMRPQLREAFADSAPLIHSFTDGIIALGENAMPGLVRAVASAGPVFDGLESFLGSVGTGLSDFFDAISGHAPAAGSVFASLGDIMGDLLPIFGELIGQGAELAADVLPAISVATGMTLDVLEILGPLLPSIVAGFVAFKAAKAAAGYLQTFAVQAQYATIAATGSVKAGESVGGAMSKAADGIGRASAALPALGIVLSGIADTHAKASDAEERWAQAILAGGDAAVKAYSEYQSGTHWGQSIDEATGLASSWEDAQAKADELRASMDPLARAQLDLTTAVRDHGAASPEAAAAADALTAAQERQEKADSDLELAIHGVTSAMIEQAEQALAAIDSGFAYRKSVDDLEDAQVALNDAIAASGAGSEEAQRAQLALEQQSYNTALAFGQQQADLSGLSADSMEYKRIVQQEMLGKLHELQAAAGPEMAAAIGQQIAMLEASGLTLQSTAQAASVVSGRMRDLGLSVHEVPGFHGVIIDAPTADQKQRIQDLGYRVETLPDGSIYVTADTAPAENALAALTKTRYMTIVANTVAGSSARAADVNTLRQAADRAMGGRVGGATRGFSGGGKLDGPGTSTSDSIPALTYSGRPLGVSDEEWVIQARSARMYGDPLMAAVNAGTARITAPGLAGGGSVGGSSRRDGALFHADTVNLIEGTPQDVAQILAYEARTKGW